MQTVLLSCVFGAVCTMVLLAIGSAAAKREQMMRRGGRLGGGRLGGGRLGGGRLAPPEEL